MLRAVFVEEGTELLEEIEKEHYEAVISILKAYAGLQKK